MIRIFSIAVFCCLCNIFFLSTVLAQNYMISNGNLWISNLNNVVDSVNCNNKYKIIPKDDFIIKSVEIHSSLMSSECITKIIEANLPLFDSVESFMISDNSLLKEIPSGIFKLDNLSSLGLYDCNLKNVSADISKLNKLKSLYIVGSNLSDSILIDLIAKVNPNLRVLSLDNNSIRSLPDNICSLSRLNILTITDNEIYQFPDCIYDLWDIDYIEYTESIQKRKKLSEEKQKQKECIRAQAEKEFKKKGKKTSVR